MFLIINVFFFSYYKSFFFSRLYNKSFVFRDLKIIFC